MGEGCSTTARMEVYKIGRDRPSNGLAVDMLALHRVDSVIQTQVSRFPGQVFFYSFKSCIHKLPLLGVFDASYVELLFGAMVSGGYPS